MLSRIQTAVIRGLDAEPVTIETDIAGGMPVFHVVGMPDQSVMESRERVRSAIINSGTEFPMRRITVNIAPAGFRKRGSHLDLPIAVGILASSGQIFFGPETEDLALMGELSLDGNIMTVPGILPMILMLKRQGFRQVIVPKGNAEEAGLVPGIRIYVADTLEQVIDHYNMKETLPVTEEPDVRKLVGQLEERRRSRVDSIPDFSEVKGQEGAKRGALIAAAGGHSMLMTGSPATGKSMIAERIPSILPPMSYEEILHTTMIWSGAGMLNESDPLVLERPFRRPHQRITAAGLVGGGSVVRPGEVTLASGGVLFLDEIGEFQAGVLDQLRVPLEEKTVRIVRGGEIFSFPADFLLIAATNPCKCGYFGDPEIECTCTATMVKRYQEKLSGPLMDRIDLHLQMVRVDYDSISENHPGLDSDTMRSLVIRARETQRKRYAGTGLQLNGQLSGSQTEAFIPLDPACETILASAYRSMKLNPRTLHKVRRIARTIADLEGSEPVRSEHILEALQYRPMEHIR